MKYMKITWAIVGGMIAMGSGCQAQKSEQPKTTEVVQTAPVAATSPVKVQVKNITGDEYLKLKADNPEVQLLDVRTPEEVSEGFIEGAAKFNVHDAQFTEKVEANLSKSAPVVVYCMAGGRSARAADMLAQKGFTQVYNITGGISTWKQEGKPTVK